MFFLSSYAAFAQAPQKTQGFPTDWSDAHLIFSQPATPEQAARVQKNPRYWNQLHRRNSLRTSGVPTAPLPFDPNPIEANQFKPDPFDSEPASDFLLPELAPDFPYPEKAKQSSGDWSQSMGSGATVGSINYPAKYSFSTTTANCASAAQPDFVVYGTRLAGSDTQASIVAYDNLYAGCAGTVPQVYWAYNTGGTVTTSPVFSSDGTQVAFTQVNSLGQGLVVLLRWAPSTTETITNPLTINRVSNQFYPTCTAPCMTTTLLVAATGTVDNDTNSSVFYDYSTDMAYVGDDAGWLHEIAPFFDGIPAEVRAGGFPVQVNSTSPTALTGTVYDDSSGYIFVGDVGGYVYRVGPFDAFVVQSGRLDYSSSESGLGLVQSPIVDSTSGSMYVFSSSDGSTACTKKAACAAVFHMNTPFPPGFVGTEALVGNSTVSGTAPNPLYIGGFDNTYLNSSNATGNMYVCGNTGGDPTLYQIAVQNTLLGGVATGPVISKSATPCSPVTDVYNPNAAGGAAEWIFASAQTKGQSSACGTAGCIVNFKDPEWQPATVYKIGQEVVDTHFQIQVAITNGTSGTTLPSWQQTAGNTTTDGSVNWLDQGVETATTPAAWAKNHSYLTVNAKILDPNGNIEFVTTPGISSATEPTFNTTAGGTTNDFTVVWTNLGANPTSATAEAGGTSGIVYDNTVSAGTLTGASQVYFSTLSNQACGTTGTGGCAIQASQSGLK